MSTGVFDPPEVRRREQRGWYFYDWAASAFSMTVGTVFLGPYLTSIVESAAGAGKRITLFGVIPVTAESYVPYGVALSVLVQLLLSPAGTPPSASSWPASCCGRWSWFSPSSCRPGQPFSFGCWRPSSASSLPHRHPGHGRVPFIGGVRSPA